ncbi:MAG: Murein hydrolase activator NlpD precursor [Syntrophus sp. PtaU1.Bin208]|nr:MAG: Murein hydrolase activator NlpD precursor [Syntrophus sp. PtaU1.Bin208]
MYSQNEEPTLSRLTLSKKHFLFLFLLIIPFIFSTGYGFNSGKPKGVYHRVKKGETLYSIARAYSVHVQDLAEVNNVENLNQVEVDQVLFIPDANEVVEDVILQMRNQGSASGRKKPASGGTSISTMPPGREGSSPAKQASKPESSPPSGVPFPKTSTIPPGSATGEVPEKQKEEATPTKREDQPVKESPPAPSPAPPKNSTGPLNKKEELPTEAAGKLQFDKKRFVWPVKGRVISRFGIQPNKMYHNWISISAKDMMPVVAAASGTVIFSSELKDYGETIIIKHADNFATVYTHLKVRKVHLDDAVKKGEPIALVGKIGEEDKIYLNFEVRHQNRARNPLFFLP